MIEYGSYGLVPPYNSLYPNGYSSGYASYGHSGYGYLNYAGSLAGGDAATTAARYGLSSTLSGNVSSRFMVLYHKYI